MLFDDFRVTILSISAIALFGLAFLIIYINRRHQTNGLFGVWLVFVAAWALSIAFFFSAPSVAMASLWMKAAYSSALLCITTFFYFSLRFIDDYPFNRIILIMGSASLIIFSVYIMVSDIVVYDMIETVAPAGYRTVLRPIGWYIYTLFLLVHFLAAHLVLFVKFMKTSGLRRLQLKYVLISVFFGGEVFGVLFNLILPSPFLDDWRYIWLGPTASAMIIAPTIAYAILRSKLFNTKGFITEIIIFYTVFLILVDTLLTRMPFVFMLRLFIMVGVVTLGVILVQNIRKEDVQKRELRNLMSRLATANKKLEKRDRMRSEFISIASHQLRTPVSVMRGYLSLMLDGTYGRVPKKLSDRLRQMYEMNERLILLINNMLNMSRIEKNRIEFGFKELKVDDVAKAVAREMAYKAEQKGLVIKVKPHDGKMPYIVSDEEKIREIIANLIDNAVKYTQGGLIELSFGVDHRNRWMTVYVRDTGSGMRQEDTAKIFRRFSRVNNPEVPKESGTGLGLFIAARFLKGMGGSIWIDKTEPGIGTTFAFRIPFNPPNGGPDDDGPRRKK